MWWRSRFALALVIAGAAAACAQAGGPATVDYAGTALDIMPSGQYGSLPPPPGADEQARMYDALTPRFDQVSLADLPTYFKSESLGIDASSLPSRIEAVPRPGVTIERDRFNVPHITGLTRDDVTWATGWVTQEDRGLLVQSARYVARLAAIDAPNVDAYSLIVGFRQLTPSRTVEREIARTQTAALLASGARGRAVLHDIDVYVQGINDRMRAEGLSAAPLTRVDVFALNALSSQMYGAGGGHEAFQAMRLDALRKRLRARRGSALFDDLTGRSGDLDTPVTVEKPFPYGGVPREAPGSVVLDEGSFRAAAVVGAARRTAARPLHRKASSFIAVAAERSTNGHPLLVAGPQVGLLYPNVLLEVDLKGPGFAARGATGPGFPGIVIGRGPDSAWSQTTAATDLVDTFAETLCGGSRTRYLYRGRCRPMGVVDAGTIADEGEVTFHTTVHGPVVGYARVAGRPVALSRKRASFGRDTLALLPYRALTLGQVTSASSFIRAFAPMPLAFNVVYVDDRDIAMVSTGRLPLRDPRVDPRLPTRGTGEYEWRGFLPAARHAQAIDPPGGVLVNWNNKPAPRFGNGDGLDYVGTVYRSQLLTAGLATRRVHDLGTVVAAMNRAATQDPVSFSVLPTLARVLHGGPPPSERAGRMLGLLEAWRATGGSHLDRDLDGFQDAGAGPVVLAAAWPRIVRATIEPGIGPKAYAVINERFFESLFIDEAPSQAHVDKALRQALGERLRSPFRTQFCVPLAACRARLWRALDETAAELEARLGSDPGTWKAQAAREDFRPVRLRSIRSTQRPNGFQQVVTFVGHRPAP
jgi:acyl-homoserine lactone acylase PvdQ